MTMADGLVGVLGAIVSGAVLAVALAISLSPLSPLGPIRAVYRPAGIEVDWTVLGLGLLVLIGGLGLIALALAYRGAPHRCRDQIPPRSSPRFETAPGCDLVGPSSLRCRGTPLRSPVRSRQHLGPRPLRPRRRHLGRDHRDDDTHVQQRAPYPGVPARTLRMELELRADLGERRPPSALAALDHDRHVAAWSGYHNISVQIDGETVPVLIGDDHATVAPPILSGHAVDAGDQVVLGPSTLALLHKKVGDSVIGSFGTPNTAPLYLPPFKLVITGTATLPAIGGTSNFADHPSMGSGAVLSDHLSPTFLRATESPDPNLDGPGLVFVRLRNGVSAAAGLADMNRIATLSDKVFASDPRTTGDSVEVLGVQHPLEIVNYQSTGATPVILATGLAGGAIVALALTLTASVRRRRRDLALLKTLGFTARQLAATIAWQASVVAAIAAIVGLPVGIAAGRQLWTLFANSIDAVPQPTVPASLFLVAAGVVILANLVAVIPARIAARTPAALVLRAE